MNTQKRIRIEHDETPMHPRIDMCNLGTMACWHGRYNLGDEQPSCDPLDHMISLIEEHDPEFEERLERRCDRMFHYMSKESLRSCNEYQQEQVEEAFDKYYISLPLYLFDHGGITMNTTGFHCRWDSGQVGFIYVSRAEIRKEFDWKRISKAREKQIMTYLEGEVETFDQFIRGDVYGFIVEERPADVFDADGEELWEEIDSCWGFFGDDPFENGISDHIGKELHPLLKEAA